VRAARAAGLEVLRTLSEPVAGAIAYRLDGFTGRRRVLVYDFGGGTFDATVLEQDDARFRPICVGGDACLGGDDLDHALAHLARRQTARAQRLVDEAHRVSDDEAALAVAHQHEGPACTRN
jgi:molecular chaperone DnaK (HSP70)